MKFQFYIENQDWMMSLGEVESMQDAENKEIYKYVQPTQDTY